MFYSGGILAAQDCGTDPNLSVAVVGSGYNEYRQGYDVVKTSLGSTWGLEGFIRLEALEYSDVGTCGMYKDLYYPFAHLV